MHSIEEFKKKSEFLVCVDSDGTALDTMTVKHLKCFGPCFVCEWELQKINDYALKRWNDINLYESTRGKNRFITLSLILQEFNGSHVHADLKNYFVWLKNTNEISAASLEKAVQESNDETMIKALRWSNEVNKKIAKLTYSDKKPFEGVREFLGIAHKKADIAVVSSADAKSMTAEWEHHGLCAYVDVITSQEVGTKNECLSQLISKGYDKQKVFMIGDSLPDIFAAEEQGILFFPILAGDETKCWASLKDVYFECFLSGRYINSQDYLKQAFHKQFSKENN